MTDQHPITPLPEQLRQWKGMPLSLAFEAAYRAGADQELEACVEWLTPRGWAVALHEARRSKPPRLAEEALNELDLVPTHDQDGRSIDADTSVIRRALERLQELEHND